MHERLDRALELGASRSGALLRSRPPIFPLPITECTTANSSPYFVSFAEFTSRYGSNAHRARLLGELAAFIAASRALGVSIGALLVGGSFLDQALCAPRDIDCLVYYEIDEGTSAGGDVHGTIAAWDALRKTFPLDVKICPTDTGAMAIIKRSIFFSNLFSIDKSSGQLATGTLLVSIPPIS